MTGDRPTLETADRLADVGGIIDAIDAQLAWLDDEGAEHSAPGPWASLSVVNKRLRQAVRDYRERLPLVSTPLGEPTMAQAYANALGVDVADVVHPGQLDAAGPSVPDAPG